jgi:hypothetical protein
MPPGTEIFCLLSSSYSVLISLVNKRVYEISKLDAGVKEAEEWSWSFTSIESRGYKFVELHVLSPIRVFVAWGLNTVTTSLPAICRIWIIEVSCSREGLIVEWKVVRVRGEGDVLADCSGNDRRTIYNIISMRVCLCMETGWLGVLEGKQRILGDWRPVYVFGCVKVCLYVVWRGKGRTCAQYDSIVCRRFLVALQ